MDCCVSYFPSTRVYYIGFRIKSQKLGIKVNVTVGRAGNWLETGFIKVRHGGGPLLWTESAATKAPCDPGLGPSKAWETTAEPDTDQSHKQGRKTRGVTAPSGHDGTNQGHQVPEPLHPACRCYTGVWHLENTDRGVPDVPQQKRIWLGTKRLQVRCLASLRGLRIWRCCGCGVGYNSD